ncbi:hypothetical protein FNZ56_07050 [Pseudoluteimonas lycopersici]|uniref:Uncharacterized protein n=1 Tax=Pseudoluteimonas lycopersici TaxID=1324796 RepID=A0A516V546_9GAMM|nr:hypothetical protein [Lysobacter lycopersici]QDQ73649.1 hypothetical protein FNZ56_07050 [Lysobacter lycopersici]
MDKSNERRVHTLQAMLLVGTFSALPLLANNACSDPMQPMPKVGDEHEIIKSYETSEQSSEGSTGSSRGRDAILERVIGMRDGGFELEYDLPKSATTDDRSRNWQFPARVFRSKNGAMQLVNDRELEARADGWLKAAGLTHDACGRWIFTWDAFRIECDPQSVLKTLEAFDLSSAVIREGASYQDIEAKSAGTLTRKATGPNGSTYTVVMEIDPDAVRRARADSDVVVGEITQKPVTLDEALLKRANEIVTGTITVTFDTDLTGNVRSRTKVTKVETKNPDGRSESRTSTETVERRLVSESTSP